MIGRFELYTKVTIDDAKHESKPVILKLLNCDIFSFALRDSCFISLLQDGIESMKLDAEIGELNL